MPAGLTVRGAGRDDPAETRWGWTRHPNYFGDAGVWWGLWLAGALSTGRLPGLLPVVAPVAMTAPMDFHPYEWTFIVP